MLNIGRTMVAGAITMSIFVSKALSKFIENQLFLEIMTNPLVIFSLFCTAGIILMLPFLRGWRALVLGPTIVIIAAFFVYSYYIV